MHNEQHPERNAPERDTESRQPATQGLVPQQGSIKNNDHDLGPDSRSVANSAGTEPGESSTSTGTENTPA